MNLKFRVKNWEKGKGRWEWKPVRILAAIFIAVFFVSGLTGCALLFPSQKSDEQFIEGARQQTYIESRRRDGPLELGKEYERTSLDINRDGHSDQWIYKNKRGVKVLIVRDMNFDKEPDIWQYFDRAGNIIELEHNLDRDDRVELVELKKGGKTRQKIISVTSDGFFSIRKYYNESGRLLRVERDRNRDGRTDTWEYFDEEGNRTRVGWDEDLDGNADTFNTYE